MASPPEELVAGRYRVGRLIARGGTSAVHEAVHEVTGRGVALKITDAGRPDAARLRARMHLEARTLGAIRHHGIVAIHDAGDLEDGRTFLALELLDGKPLDALLTARRTLGVADAARVCMEVAAALAAAHDQGVAHRDVKPSNVIIVRGDDSEDVAKLIDFGIAAPFGPAADGTTRLTRRDEIVGTPEYLSPERLDGAGPVDPRGDEYALAIMLYELLTGDVPFPGSYGEIVVALASRGMPPIGRADVPPELEAIVARGLAREPAARFGSIRELAQLLRPFARGPRSALLPPPASDIDPSEVELIGDPAARPPPLPHARRRFARASFVAPVRIAHAQGTAVGESEDLSEGGMLVVTAEAFPDDVHAVVSFTPPGFTHELDVRAAVRWTHQTRRGTAFGVEFVEPPAELRAAAAAWAARPSRGKRRR